MPTPYQKETSENYKWGKKSGSASNSCQAVVTVKVAIDALFVIAALTSALPSAVF